jgi:hypothetical protein
MKGWQELLRVAAGLRFEPHDIAANLDGNGHYAVELDGEFPLLINYFVTPPSAIRLVQPGTIGWSYSCRSMVPRVSGWDNRK